MENAMMQMPVIKTAMPIAAPQAAVLALAPKRPALKTRLLTRARTLALSVVPPLVVIAFALLLWELLCSQPGATLPPPSKVVGGAWELISNPFYDRGGLDKGLF